MDNIQTNETNIILVSSKRMSILLKYVIKCVSFTKIGFFFLLKKFKLLKIKQDKRVIMIILLKPGLWLQTEITLFSSKLK